jgi:diguanylate cyclase (GGDEF)-like protein/PAS domain S-box-containing protein
MATKQPLARTKNSFGSTVTARLVLGIALGHLLLVPLLFGAIGYLIKQQYQEQFIEYVRVTSPLFAQMIRADEPSQQVAAMLDEVLLSGEVLYAELLLEGGERIEPLLGNPPARFQEDFFFGQHGDSSYFIALPVRSLSGQQLGRLRLGFGEQFTRDNIHEAYWRVAIMAVIYFVLSAMVVSLIGLRLTRSIRQIGETSQAIAQGNLDHPFMVRSSSGELRQLVANLENMRLTLIQDRRDIRDREVRLQTIVDNMAEGVITMDEQGLIESFNRSAEAIFGYPAAAVLGKNVDILVARAADVKHNERLGQYLNGAKAKVIGQGAREVMARHQQGHSFPIDLSVSEMMIGGRRVFCGIVRDITERAAQKAILEHQATHDSLTGLPNRYMCQDRMQQMITRSRREGQVSAVLLMDLDGFKAVNDQYGHDYGDVLLVAVAERLEKALRASDTVARIGGDEFVVLSSDVGDASGAIIVAKNILAVMPAPFHVKERELRIGISIGIALYPQHGEDDETLMRHADQAMYGAKRSGSGYQLSDAVSD